ncbi:class I SAM-dependent methyltransferase [Pseudomonas viridiflava]|uniref:methyltransferase domain-containing protein n=1 Tax=Pseudomonas viridiflava TaxID=33069 RepID=UPI001FD6BA55|nr:methyltransferase domain-containing protein [Pseudomonas viridiflava]MCJ8177150.1 class I SAM-dependent methyltransferase [Pseudomonas viridiflava]MEE4092204.1 methyltransferase domain-containing protein [Pseudomonas viridiflava]
MFLAQKYCQGHGIELGAAAHNSFGLTNCLNVAPCDGVSFLHPQDMDDYQQYVTEQVRVSGKVAKVDVIGDFQSIRMDDASVDYLISSHVIEHVPNLFSAYIEASRVIKDGGVCFLIFPKRIAAATDRVRCLTTLDKMIDDHERNVDMTTVESGAWRGHYQVFSLQSMIRAINYMNSNGLGCWYIECVEETDTKVGNGHTLVLRKFERLGDGLWSDLTVFNDNFNRFLMQGQLDNALSLIKVQLSFDFFDANKLYLASVLCRELGLESEGIEFLRQSLVVDPENEKFRSEFLALTGVHYANPVL